VAVELEGRLKEIESQIKSRETVAT